MDGNGISSIFYIILPVNYEGRDKWSEGRGRGWSGAEKIAEPWGEKGVGWSITTFVVALTAAKPRSSGPPRGPHRETIKPRVMG